MNNIFIKKTAFFLAAFITLSSLFCLSGCSNNLYQRTFFAADTVCTVTVYKGSKSALDKAVDLCNDLAKDLNCKDENSKISKLNSLGELKNPDEEITEVINSGIYFSTLSKGTFDITVKPLSDIWDFKNEILPESSDINAALSLINYKNITVDEDLITLKNGSQLDLGGIAKGYIAQKIKDLLVNEGVTSAIINLGGNVTLVGDNKGNDFSVGLQKPFSEDLLAEIEVSDTSVVTSGTYQRCFEKNGTIYHHLLNLTTGYPEENGLSSVTVITDFGTGADALSTVCFLLGKEKGTELINSLPNTEAIFVDSKNNIHLTTGLEMQNGKIRIKKQ